MIILVFCFTLLVIQSQNFSQKVFWDAWTTDNIAERKAKPPLPGITEATDEFEPELIPDFPKLRIICRG